MNKQKTDKRAKGYLKIDRTKEVFQIREISFNKKEIVLSVITPAVACLI
ncbi:hypothetical protein [Poritiphilus flavus]|uniref:Uncharacterized protein n=1 Tax=Poritiphilus flavus TaxID=2697053 RepID=A0A6L9E6W6_9FLAO|nr:hypothetical protein [Poritiphilus flavus]NAS10430.1 hypothetical protein [Poritiphilus flavus]